ncbi:hypothetical protein Pan14r_01640 [Crateriforma conspicua]|uniref:Uncharacterized protein n=1 Tax=Crateriforma conspicua TaxID=2527996 RepID=A0A5C5XX04_9PLAN|nr:hypothetical protein Pan14r_01640 [Crateriforma conspicua]
MLGRLCRRRAALLKKRNPRLAPCGSRISGKALAAGPVGNESIVTL